MIAFWVVKNVFSGDSVYMQSVTGVDATWSTNRDRALRFTDRALARTYVAKYGGRPVRVTRRAGLLEELRDIAAAWKESGSVKAKERIDALIARHGRGK